MLESLTWERVGEEEDPEGSHSQNVRGELGWGVRRLFVLYFLGRGGEQRCRVKAFVSRARDGFGSERFDRRSDRGRQEIVLECLPQLRG